MTVTPLKWGAWFGVALSLAAALLATLRSVETTFNVAANTEFITFTADSFSMPAWHLHDVTVTQGLAGPTRFDSLEVRFSPGARVRLERIALGPLRISAGSADNTSSAGAVFLAGGSSTTLGAEFGAIMAEIAEGARKGRVATLPVRGAIQLGTGGAMATRGALLRSGSVTMLDRAILGSTRFDVRTASLDPGDSFMVGAARAPAVGVIRADERSALTTAYRVLAKEARVTRFASQGYTMSTSLRDRILKDHVLQGIWLTTLALIGLANRFGKRSRPS